jgi:TonB family protein
MKMFSRFSLLVLTVFALGAAPPSGANLERRAGNAKMVSSPPFPPEAKKKGVEGNVVLTGQITAQGDVTGLRVLASSSPLLEDTAVQYIGKWKFAPATEGGSPVPLTINAVVRFRKDRVRVTDPGTLPEPIVGNLAVTPADRGGKSTANEGFPIEPRDGGVKGVLDIDLPKSAGTRKFHVVVTDVLPSGKAEVMLDQSAFAGNGSIYNVTLFRAIDARRPAEQGTHTIKVAVDGRNAGGALYRVGPPSVSLPPPKPTKK